MASVGTVLPSPGEGGGPQAPAGPDAGQDPNSPGPGGGPISPQPAMPNPHAQLEQWSQELIQLTRRIKMRYPATTQNMVTIQTEMMRAMKQAIQSNPAPEPMAPPV